MADEGTKVDNDLLGLGREEQDAGIFSEIADSYYRYLKTYVRVRGPRAYIFFVYANYSFNKIFK